MQGAHPKPSGAKRMSSTVQHMHQPETGTTKTTAEQGTSRLPGERGPSLQPPPHRHARTHTRRNSKHTHMRRGARLGGETGEQTAEETTAAKQQPGRTRAAGRATAGNATRLTGARHAPNPNCAQRGATRCSICRQQSQVLPKRPQGRAQRDCWANGRSPGQRR